MDKEQIKRIIVSNQQYVQKVKLMQRDFYFEEMGNYVFIGIRRAGKSFLMFQRIQEMLSNGISPEHILYINFEDDRLINLTIEDLDLIFRSYGELYAHKPIFFFDEIQIVPGWEKFVRRLADNNYRVYVTGSNAKMLSNEIMTTLGGRFLVKEVYPFSLKEIFSYNGIDTRSKQWEYDENTFSKAMRLFNDYFYNGGFPELLHFEQKREWLRGLYQKIFFGDIVTRYNVRNKESLRLLVKKLAETVKHPVSYNRLKNTLASAGADISINTVPQYLNYLSESILIFSIRNFIGSFSEKELSKKYYFTDNGILNLFLFDPETALMENLVALTLYKKYKDELYFYNKNVEADFYVPKEKLLVQACLKISDDKTFIREVSSLSSAAKYLKSERQLIITKDDELSIDEGDVHIEVIPVWKWLLYS